MKIFVSLLLLALHLFANIPHQITYNENNQPLIIEYADGTVTTTSNTYDAFNRLVSSTDALGQTTTNAYDARGNKVSVTDSQGRVTAYTYNNHNKLTLTTYPDNTTESKTYDAMDNLLSETNAEGETTSYEYDDADRLTKTTYADNTTTSSTYDAAGRTLTTTDQNNNTTTYEYDAVGSRISTTDALGNTTTFTYDAQGNMLTMTDALAQTTSYTYNALNQRIQTTYADGTSTQALKNTSGLPSSKVDEAGLSTQYGYDTLKAVPLLNSVTLANGAITSYGYDSEGKKLSQTDALSHTTSWSYTDKGQLQTETLPQGEQKTFTYDSYGKQTQITDYANKAQKFIYDSYDRLVRIELADGSTTTYAYTPSGRVKSITDSNTGTITNTYDNRCRLKSQTNPDGETISYSYDGVGNIIEVQTPTQTITKTYDALNRLETVTDAQGTVTYTYDAVGRQAEVSYANGVSTSYEYDSRNRVTNIAHKKSDGTVLQSFAYTLDAVGNRTKIVEQSGRTVDYTYNEVHQLTEEVVSNDPNGNNTTTTFTYDAVGNLVKKIIDGVQTNYAYNDNDQLETRGSISYTYDANGNLISDGTNTYSYDDKNRLVRTTTPTNTIEYSYDANDNRIAKIVNGDTTTYLVDTNTEYAQVITESKEDGTEVNYTYGNDLLSNGTHNFLTDALGSTRGLIDHTEQLTDTYNYTPYGELKEHTGTSENNFLYTGEQLDTETNDYYLRARYYSPNNARFLTRDTYDGTAGNPITQNHYLYAGSNPSLYVDPSGNTYTASGLSNIMAVSATLGGIAGSNSVRILMGLLQKMPGIVTSGVRGLARGAARDAGREGANIGPSQLAYIYTMARLYSRFAASEKDEPNKVPIQVYGSNNLPEHQSHIASAFWFTPSVLHKKDKAHNRYWLKKAMPNCNGARDEYPYASTYEGGKKNYDKGRVSLQCVSISESGRQGRFIGVFYGSNTPLYDGDAFIVVPMGGISGYFDKRWMWHSFPKGR